jgi:hypothetical protein
MRIPSLLVLTISSLFLFSTQKIKAQYSEDTVVKKSYTADGIINIIIDHIPARWSFKEENCFFIFQRNDSIWQLTENTLNVPFEKKEDRMKRIQATGIKTVSKIVIRYEDKWDFLKLQEASISNSSVKNEIRSLPDKMEIRQLKDTKLSSKGNSVYTPKTEADKIRLEKYYLELKKLESKIISVPDNSSQKYSLFYTFESGYNDNTHYIYPEEASNELFQIKNLFRELCGH